MTVRRVAFFVFSVLVLAMGVGFLARRGEGRGRYQAFDRVPSIAMGTARDGGLALRGQVIGANAATVHWQGHTLETRADGSFELPPFAEGAQVWATAPGLASRIRWISVETWPAETLLFDLLPAASLSLTLSGPGGPVAGGTVSFNDEVVTTDAAGLVTLEALPAERTLFLVHADGYHRAVVSPDLRPGQRTTLVVDLIRSASISGRVIDSQDAGVSGAIVRASRVSTRLEAAHTQTDSSGFFELAGLPPRAFRVNVTLAGSTSVNVPVMAPGRDLEVRLEPGASVRGVLVDSAGRPVRGVEVSLVAPEGQVAPAQRSNRTLTTDAAGRFAFDDVRAGAWGLSANPPGDAPPDVELQLAAGEVKEVRLKLPQAQRTVKGVVVDAESAFPVRRARISSSTLGLEVEASPRGEFSFELLGADKENLWVTAEGYVPERFTSRPAAEPVTIRLERLRWISGRVVDAARLPLTHFFLDDHEYFSPEGKFLAALPKDAEALTVKARGFVPRRLEGKVTEQGDVVLEEAPRTGVKVVDPRGKPVGDAEVWVTADVERTPLAQLLSPKQPTLVGTTDVEGQLSFVPLEEGCLFTARYPFLPSSLDGCPATGPELVLTLRAPAAVRGVVTANGVPERGVLVTDGADEGWAVTDAQGKYELGVLTPGPVELHFARQFTSGDAATIYFRRPTLRDEGVARFDLALGEGCAVDVEVKVPEAMTIALAISNAEMIPNQRTMPSRVDLRRIWVAAGSTVIRFDGLPPGRSWVVAGPDGEALHSQPVELHEGVIERTTTSISRPGG